MKRWMKIVDDLIEDITEGRYRKDTKLPSESILVEKYGVSRHDVRKAFEHLTDMGYIYSIQGKGRYYKSKKDKIPFDSKGGISFTKKMQESGYNLETLNIRFEEIKDSPKLKEELEVGLYDKIYKISRLRKINGEPAAIHISYVSDAIFKNIEEDGPHITSLYDYFKQAGYKEYVTTSEGYQIMLPTSYEREVLECPHLVPIRLIEGKCYDKVSGQLLEFSKIIYRGDRFIFK